MSSGTPAADLRRLAAAVLLPATADSHLPPALAAFLAAGGRSVLLGETRAEYLARRMSDDRRRTETPAAFGALVDALRGSPTAPVLVALDQELGGIQRAHDLVPALPAIDDVAAMSTADLTAACGATARGLRELGVGLTLGPIVDLVGGPQPWLDGRHHGDDPTRTARIGAAYVAAFETAGVATCPKHFPGHRGLRADPAVDSVAVVPGDRLAAAEGLRPFAAAVDAGATAVMVGPAAVPGLGAPAPALLSAPVVRVLRDELRFGGLVISDDLDAASVLHGRTLHEAAVASLRAGCDLLLVSAENDLPALTSALVRAVADGALPAARLEAAARAVGAVADRFGVSASDPRPGRPHARSPAGG
jgi:beta-N-acetylhexosaminidase